METRNKINIGKIRGTRKEEKKNTPINTKTNVWARCYVSQIRNNTNCSNDNNNSIINTCRSNIKPNHTEKEEYLKPQLMQAH